MFHRNSIKLLFDSKLLLLLIVLIFILLFRQALQSNTIINPTKHLFIMKLKFTLFLLMQAFCFHQISAQCSGVDFEERSGIAVLEMESKSNSGFKNETATGASKGRTLAYRGSNSFNSPGKSTITYSLKINSPGTYRFIWRNKIGIRASSNASTEHNDAWLKINASNFYGQRGSSRVFPGGSGKSPVAEGSTSGGWFKVYTNTIDWSYSTKTSDFDAHTIYASFSKSGTYTIQVSGRSNGHFIDRMVLYKESMYSASQAESLSRAQTNCSGGTPPPPPPPVNNASPSVSFKNISDNQVFELGESLSIALNASDSDGTVVSHEIFVNGSIVDTDGVNYSPYKLVFDKVGNYTVRARVKDNDGAVTSKTITVVVREGNTPTPPTPPTPTENASPTLGFANISDNQVFDLGDKVNIALNASDSDGTVVKHEIFVNGSLVDTDGLNYTPYQLVFNKLGDYTLRASIEDNDGAKTSKTIKLTVKDDGSPTPPGPIGNASPTLEFITISDDQVFDLGDKVNIALKASDSDGTVVTHKIFVNGSLVDTDGLIFTPYPLILNQLGNVTLKASVEDNDGAITSKTIIINVKDGSVPNPPGNNVPTLNFINLSDGQRFRIGETITVNLNAVDIDGSIAKYEIFVNNVLVDTDGVLFTPYLISNAKSGNYVIKASATDSEGAIISKVITVNVSNDVTSPSNIVPTVEFLSPTSNQSFFAGGNFSVDLKANDVDGTVTKYQIFVNDVLVDTDGTNFTPYVVNDLAAGTYTLRAEVTDDEDAVSKISTTVIVSNVSRLKFQDYSKDAFDINESTYVYPNPIFPTEILTIKLREKSNETYMYNIMNSAGVQIEKGSFVTIDGQAEINNSFTSSVKGIYYINVLSNGKLIETIPLIRK